MLTRLVRGLGICVVGVMLLTLLAMFAGLIFIVTVLGGGVAGALVFVFLVGPVLRVAGTMVVEHLDD